MRKVHEVLRLRTPAFTVLPGDQRGAWGRQDLGREIVPRAEVIGLTWPLPEVFDDGELECLLSQPQARCRPSAQLPIGRSCMRSSSGAA